MNWIIGIDEVGRGPLAGPITICVFASLRDDLLSLFDKRILKDSKLLTKKKREQIYKNLTSLDNKSVRYAVLHREASEIDSRGIATCVSEMIEEGLKNMAQTLELEPSQMIVKLDGSLYAPGEYVQTETIVRGDSQVVEIACASIIAKVTRDEIMTRLGEKHPKYGFEQHSGYATAAHRKAIAQHGLTREHRKSFIHFA